MPKSPESRITLEALLKLKRFEEPEAAFWDRFDRDLENRRLRALITDDKASALVRGRRWWRSMTWAMGGMGAAAAAVVALLGVPQMMALRQGLTPDLATHASASAGEAAPVELVSLDPLPAEAETFAQAPVRPNFEQMESRFVIDAIPSQFEPIHFRRILANPAFQGTRQVGAEFVADALLTNNRPRATFAVDRGLGQF